MPKKDGFSLAQDVRAVNAEIPIIFLTAKTLKDDILEGFTKPEILNSDQGSQFTGRDYIEYVEKNAVKISMDGKSRWADNIMIERWFRTLKYDEVYLKDYENIRDARSQIGDFIHKYNFEKLHSALGYQTPAENYYSALKTCVA
ncbi:integrase core domain-containing protein [Streptococcus pneumoniae]